MEMALALAGAYVQYSFCRVHQYSTEGAYVRWPQQPRSAWRDIPARVRPHANLDRSRVSRVHTTSATTTLLE